MPLHEVFAPTKVAVITGAADGIGRAAAERYASLGMHLLLADIHGERLAALARELVPRAGQRVLTQVVDVARLAEVVALKELAYREFGRVDVLMNNAGTSQPNTAWGDLDAWRRIIEVNLWGVVHGIHAFTGAMVAQGTPALIVNTGSKQGITNPPGNPAYNLSKAGVRSASETLQHELRNTPGCRVSAHLLVPGYTYTGFTQRKSKPDGAWLPAEVIDYLLAALSRGSFYIICPDNEVSSAEDGRRLRWAAGDLSEDRPPLSRWHPDYQEAYKNS